MSGKDGRSLGNYLSMVALQWSFIRCKLVCRFSRLKLQENISGLIPFLKVAGENAKSDDTRIHARVRTTPHEPAPG